MSLEWEAKLTCIVASQNQAAAVAKDPPVQGGSCHCRILVWERRVPCHENNAGVNGLTQTCSQSTAPATFPLEDWLRSQSNTDYFYLSLLITHRRSVLMRSELCHCCECLEALCLIYSGQWDICRVRDMRPAV